VRVVVQRVSRASVRVGEETVGTIGGGLVVLVGVGTDDQEADVVWMADKVRTLRVFRDADDVMNKSVEDVGGAVLAISQFTLMGDVRHGRRPSYITAAPPERAEVLYEAFCARLRAAGVTVATGRFQAMMDVELVNDGPVTILLDSRKTF
jgi:D-aminoacyl-tRNA deacylase